MRLLLSILLTAASVHAGAQAFWFGGRGGFLINRPPTAVSDGYFQNPQGGTGWLMGLTTSVEIKKWLQIGIGFDRLTRNYSYESPLQFRAADGVFNYIYEVNGSAFSGYVFANYRRMFRQSFIYGGMQFGDYQALSESITSYRSNDAGNPAYAGSSGTSPGAFVGWQLGFGYHVTGNWYVQGEASARYRPQATMYVITERASGQQQHVQRSTAFAYYPVVFSINYRLNTARHKHIEVKREEDPDIAPGEEEEEDDDE